MKALDWIDTEEAMETAKTKMMSKEALIRHAIYENVGKSTKITRFLRSGSSLSSNTPHRFNFSDEGKSPMNDEQLRREEIQNAIDKEVMEKMVIFENAFLAKRIDICNFQPTPPIERNLQSFEGSRRINLSPNINISSNLSTNIHIGTTSNPLVTDPNPINTPALKKHRKSITKRI